MRQGSLAAVVCLAVLLAPSAGRAQQDSREREAIRRMRQQIGRLEQDNVALQREKSELEAQLKAVQTEVARAKRRLGQAHEDARTRAIAEKESLELRATLGATEAQLKQADASARLAQSQAEALQGQLHEAQAAAERRDAQTQTTENRLQSALEMQTGRADACAAKNAELYSVTMDLIHKYKENRGTWEKFLLSEPFTGLKSVQVENLLEDMGERAADAKVTSPVPQR